MKEVIDFYISIFGGGIGVVFADVSLGFVWFYGISTIIGYLIPQSSL